MLDQYLDFLLNKEFYNNDITRFVIINNKICLIDLSFYRKIDISNGLCSIFDNIDPLIIEVIKPNKYNKDHFNHYFKIIEYIKEKKYNYDYDIEIE